MCVIAGYSGNKRAAPILLDMLRREQFIDGGKATGIVTIHEGKLYTAKVRGDVDDLIRATDAMDFPGTCGLIHSRPAGRRARHAHPFLSEDRKCAAVANGTSRGIATDEWYARINTLAEKYYQRGVMDSAFMPPTPKKLCLSDGATFHMIEMMAMRIGEEIAEKGATPENMEAAVHSMISDVPSELVLLTVHADLPGLITIGDITRSITVGMNGEESYLATSALAFPEDAEIDNMVTIPVASVAQVTPGGLKLCGKPLDGVRIEPISVHATALAYERLEKLLDGRKDDPLSIYEFNYMPDPKEFFSEPLIDCKYNSGVAFLKPSAALTYQTLYAFHKEGRLRGCLGEYNGSKMIKFWLES